MNGRNGVYVAGTIILNSKCLNVAAPITAGHMLGHFGSGGGFGGGGGSGGGGGGFGTGGGFGGGFGGEGRGSKSTGGGARNEPCLYFQVLRYVLLVLVHRESSIIEPSTHTRTVVGYLFVGLDVCATSDCRIHTLAGRSTVIVHSW